MASHSEKGGHRVLCVARGGGNDSGRGAQIQTTREWWGTQPKRGARYRDRSTQTRRGRQVSRCRSHCVLLRVLTRRIGHSQLLWDTASKDWMGIAQAAIALLARGSLGGGLVSLSTESRRRPACSGPKDDAGSRTSLTGQQPLRCRQCSPPPMSRCLVTEVFLVVLAEGTAASRLSAC